MYGLWERMELYRRARRAGMPSSWEVLKATEPRERLGLLALVTAPFVLFGAVWAGTGSVLLAGGAMLLFGLIAILGSLPFNIMAVKRGQQLRQDGILWRPTPASKLRAPGQHHLAVIAAVIEAGSIGVLAAAGLGVWLATHSISWTVAATAFAAALGMLVALTAGIIAVLQGTRGYRQ